MGWWPSQLTDSKSVFDITMRNNILHIASLRKKLLVARQAHRQHLEEIFNQQNTLEHQDNDRNDVKHFVTGNKLVFANDLNHICPFQSADNPKVNKILRETITPLSADRIVITVD